MSDPAEEAASQLRAIRALMERSTVYRTVSAPAAGFAGLLSLGVCAWLWGRHRSGDEPSPEAFLWIWLAVLLAAGAVNTLLLYRSAQTRGEAFISPGMKHALRALAPPLGAGFFMSLLEAFAGDGMRVDRYSNMVGFWILFYGLALLATGSFSPRSMQVLGIVFFVFGILTFLPFVRNWTEPGFFHAVIYMAFSFGLLHLVYAVAVLIQTRKENLPAPSGA